jgi:YD repeat-containing protein
MHENEHGDIEDKSIDKDGNTKEEKLDYDEQGRCIRKNFLENGVVAWYLEFEYDDEDRVVLTKEFENGKLEYYHVDIYVSDNENIDLRYNALGELKSKIEFKKLLEKNTLVYSSYDGQEKLLGRKEEVLDDMGESLEQRIYDGDNNLTQETIFGENDEWGYRKFMIERKYENRSLILETIIDYTYVY